MFDPPGNDLGVRRATGKRPVAMARTETCIGLHGSSRHAAQRGEAQADAKARPGSTRRRTRSAIGRKVSALQAQQDQDIAGA
jgi:hypothetical protein